MAPSHGFAAASHREAALRGAPASHGETAFRGAAGFREARRRHAVHPSRNAVLRRRAFANGKIPAARPGRHSVESRLVRGENGNALPGDRARRSRPGARQPLGRSEGAAAGPPSMRRAAMRAAAVKCRTAAVDGGYVMVAVWKSDLVGSDQLGGGLTPTGQMPSDDPKSGFADQGGKFPDRSILIPCYVGQKIPCSDA
jgi:hypothetical protein